MFREDRRRETRVDARSKVATTSALGILGVVLGMLTNGADRYQLPVPIRQNLPLVLACILTYSQKGLALVRSRGFSDTTISYFQVTQGQTQQEPKLKREHINLAIEKR